MDPPEVDTPRAPTQNPEVDTPRAPTPLQTGFLSAWNSNPVQMRLVLISLLLYMADVITDIMLAKQYYNNGDYYWFGWTLGFVMAPPTVMNILLLLFDIDLVDINLSVSKLEKCLLNFLCCALPLKYFEIINLLSCGKKLEESLKKKLCRSHLVEAMLESFPQVCLQMYIIFSTHEQVSNLKVITMVISQLTAGKAVVTYMYYDRRSPYNQSSVPLVLGLVGWKMYELSVRVLVIAPIAAVYKQWVLLPIVLHWVVMTFCVLIEIRKTGNKDVAEACLHLATCIFSTTFPMEYKYRYSILVNTVLNWLSPIMVYLFCESLLYT